MQKIPISHTSDAGQRVDRFCKKYLPNAPLGGIYKMLRTGKIKINGKKKDQTYRIQLGDELSFWMSDEEIGGLKYQHTENHVPQLWASPPASWNTPLLDILYEDESIMVINKPSGLNVHAGDHKTTESNLIDQVQDFLRWQHDSLTFRPALVHRIDRDTSGCIIIAKDKIALEWLLWQLREHKIQKIYHTLVVWSPVLPTGTIRAKILRIDNARAESKVRIDTSGQNATTHYRVLDTLSYGGDGTTVSLLECRIETGRTHQIRIHLDHIGHPIVWDQAYGKKKENSYFSRYMWVKRQLLHAYSLSFVHPITQKNITINAPYSQDLMWVLSALKATK